MDKRKKRKKYYVMNKRKLRELGDETALFLYFAFFAFGLAVGAHIIKSSSADDFVPKIINWYFEEKIKQGALQIFCASLLKAIPAFMLSVMTACSAAGFVYTFFIPVIKGCCDSLFLTFLCSGSGIKGLGYSALIIIPPQVIITAALIASLQQSKALSRSVFEKGLLPLTRDGTFALFVKKQFLFAGITVAAATLETVLTVLLSSFFFA